MYSVTVNNIVKTYGQKAQRVTALNNVSFNVKQGELFGIIGPDGAGKTSLFRVLTTLLLADSGEATVAGLDVVKDFKAIRSKVGYMPGKFSLYQDLTIEENLNFFATIFNTTIEENYHLIKDIYEQIAPFKHRRAGKLSGGMKQKLALCCALIHKPEVLFLDEPTTGVDAVSRKEFWEMLKGLKQQGITILVSTPYMDEASLCDVVALIQGGNMLQIDTPAQIIEQFGRTIIAAKNSHMLQLLKMVKQMPEVQDAYPFGEYHHIVLKKGITHLALPNDVVVKTATPNIEDCFMALMNNQH
jgi:ABC-2 type transport system ATP-binding protein